MCVDAEYLAAQVKAGRGHLYKVQPLRDYEILLYEEYLVRAGLEHHFFEGSIDVSVVHLQDACASRCSVSRTLLLSSMSDCTRPTSNAVEASFSFGVTAFTVFAPLFANVFVTVPENGSLIQDPDCGRGAKQRTLLRPLCQAMRTTKLSEFFPPAPPRNVVTELQFEDDGEDEYVKIKFKSFSDFL